MSQIFVDFKPAQLSKGVDCYVYYYVKNPFSVDKKLERIRIKLNHIKTPKERKKYANFLINEINNKLFNGYNPFYEDEKTKPIKLINAIHKYLETIKHLRKDSIRSYISICKIFIKYIEDRNLSDIYCFDFSENHAKQFSRSMTVSNTTQNNYIKFLRTLFNWFIDQQYCKENPFTKIKHKKQDPKNRETIPAHVRDDIKNYLLKNDCNFYIFCQFTFKLLIRPAELFRLKIAHINFNEKIIILPSHLAKDHDNRVIPLPDDLWIYIKTLKEDPKNYYIFSKNYEPGLIEMDSRDSGRSWNKMREKLGFSKKYTFYSLKDTGITELLNSGVPCKIVQQMAGHSSIEMTEKYAHNINAKKILEFNNLQF
jgi:integrase/recombinase XerD